MSVSQSTLAQMIRNSSSALGKAAAELGDQYSWRPLGKGRSAHDQVIEVSGMYLMTKQIVETAGVPDFDRSAHTRAMEEYDSPAKAFDYLTSSADLLANAIEVSTTERLATVVTLPFGGGVTKTIAEVVMIAYWNTVYHEGQVNYIHTLIAE